MRSEEIIGRGGGMSGGWDGMRGNVGRVGGDMGEGCVWMSGGGGGGGGCSA